MAEQGNITDSRCVWMHAGVLSYRLCDRSFDCDHCPLDIVLRTPDGPRTQPETPRAAIAVECPLPALDEAVKELLRPFSRCLMNPDLSYAPQHVWVRSFDGRLALFGIDAFLAGRLPSGFSIVPAAHDTPLQKGTPFAWLYLPGGGTIPLPAPYAGVIVRHNPAVDEDGIVLRSAPYDLGWLVTVLPTEAEDGAGLLPCADATLVVRHDMERYMDRAARALTAQAGPGGLCLNDGGFPVETLEQALGGKAYGALLSSLFPSRP